MSDNTKISWSDASWNPVSGCTEISPGCAHCYAKTFAERWRGLVNKDGTPHYYANGFDVQLRPHMLERPLHWTRPRRIFVNSMSDLFHEAVPDEYIDKVFAVMAMAPQHTFQLLTKRIERADEYLSSYLTMARLCEAADQLYNAWDWWPHARDDREDNAHPCEASLPLPNVLIGPTIENQHFADVRLPYLAQLKAMGWRTMVSYEPALTHVDFQRYLDPDCVCGAMRSKHLVPHEDFQDYLLGITDVRPTELGPCMLSDPSWDEDGERACTCTMFRPVGLAESAIDWLICGGESGPERRPFDLEWARSAQMQAREAGVPFFMKQDGALRSEVYDSLPDDLKVREFPR